MYRSMCWLIQKPPADVFKRPWKQFVASLQRLNGGKGQQMDQGQVQPILSMYTPHWRAPSQIGKYQLSPVTAAGFGCWACGGAAVYALFVDSSNFCSPSLKMCSLQETLPAVANVTRNSLGWKRRLFGELSICISAVSSGYWVKIIIFRFKCIYFWMSAANWCIQTCFCVW